MQEVRNRRSNRERTAATREKLIEAARRLFVEKSYQETGTPEIVAAAGLTRGALYHHFSEKKALFQVVVDRESEQVAREIEEESGSASTPVEALVKGGDAFLKAMMVPGRTRLLLLDGPAILGRAAMDEIDRRHGNRTLREGLAAAIEAGAIRPLPLDALTALLGAAYDRAALAVDAGADLETFRGTLAAMVENLAVDLSRK